MWYIFLEKNFINMREECVYEKNLCYFIIIHFTIYGL